MSISYDIPKSSRYLNVSVNFISAFNVPTPGHYDFGNTAACQNVVAFQLQPGTIYLIERLSVGGNIKEESYLGSIVTLPAITFRYSARKDIVYQRPIPITRYVDGLECAAWVKSDKSGENLTLSLSGICGQTAGLLGVASISLFVSLSVYAIEDNKFSSDFRNRLR